MCTLRQDWPNGPAWATVLMKGTPTGTGEDPAAAALLISTITDNMQFGIFERAAAAIAVTLMQGGDIAARALQAIEQSIMMIGCQAAAVTLNGARGHSGICCGVQGFDPKMDGTCLGARTHLHTY